LAQKSIKNFEWSNITQYLIYEGLDFIRQSTLLVDAKIASLVEPSNGVWLRVWHCRQGQLLDNLCYDEVLMATSINNEVHQGAFYPHLRMEKEIAFLWLV
jgi:hypothetical protein